MAGNPVLGFLNVRPTGTGPRDHVTKTLRLLGIVVLAGFAFGLLNNLLLITMGTTYFGGTAGGLMAAGAVGGILIGLVIAAAVCFWITFAITAWNNNEPRGSTHVLVIGIIATVLGALGVLGGLGALAFTAYPVYLLVNLVSLAIAGAEAYCGIMILLNRSKATAGTGTPSGGATGN